MSKRKYQPEYAYADMDPVVYRAAFSAQKTKYFFKDPEGNVVSPLLPSASEAKSWLHNLEDLGEDPSQYIRDSTVTHLSEDKARKKFDSIIKEYKTMAGKTVKVFEGYLTPSGAKHKAQKGLEAEYQKLREGVDKPKHFDMLRKYAESKEFIKVCPDGYEADEMLIHKAQLKGENGVVLSIDKDMCTAQGTWVIHVQKDGTGKPVWNTSLGHLDILKSGTHTKGVGGGFKFLAYQAVQGDDSDGYFGCKGMGPIKTVNLIKDCNSEQEVVEACLELYEKVYGESYTYTSWDGEEVTKTPLEMLQMHFEMPYMGDTPGGKPFDIMDYL